MSNLVRYDVQNGVAVLTIDNPPVNALSPEVWEAIEAAVVSGEIIERRIAINNNGDADLKVKSMKLSGKGAAMYKLNNSDTGRALSTTTITAGSSLTVEVRFKPTTTGDKPATVTINSDDPATPKTTVSLSGTGN